MSPPPAELFASRIFLGPALRAQPDRRLVDLVRDGYDAAFEEIVRRYRRPLDRFAAAIVGGRSEDVTQDAFSKALPALRTSSAEIELRPWLYRIVRNTALNDLRDRPPTTEELSEMLPGGRSAAAEAEAREEMRDLMDRLGALPEPQRAALVMRELEGLSHEEIATALGVSGGAARQAIYRARAALREGLGLLVPLPVLRTLVDHGSEAAMGGLGAGAIKVGMATVLVAGTVGAGVAIEHHHGGRSGPEAAEAAPLVSGKHRGRSTVPIPAAGTSSSDEASRHSTRQSTDGAPDDHGSNGTTGSLGSEIRNGQSGGPGPTGDGSHSGGSTNSGEGSHHSGSGGPGPNSGSGSDDSGSGSGDRHGGSSGSDDSSSSNSGSGSSDGGGSSGGSGSDDGLISGDGGSSGSDGGSDGGEIASEPPSEPILSESSDDGGGGDLTSGSDGSGGGTGSSGSGSSGSGSSGPDVSP